MRPYIAHLMADLLRDPTTTIAHPGYVAIVLAAYGREIGSVSQIFLPPPFGTSGRPYKARQIVFEAAAMSDAPAGGLEAMDDFIRSVAIVACHYAKESTRMTAKTMILPVIHYADDNQAMRNAERAIEAGCDGVMLIEMRGRNEGLLFAGSAIKRRWPNVHVGINHLSTETERAVHNSIAVGVDSTWTDEQLTHSTGATDLEAARLRRILSIAPPHAVFCAVAFKYQPFEPHPVTAARKALGFGFIPTTSGPATGSAADPSELQRLRDAIGPGAPLAIASGITPDNAALFLPFVSHVLVSTGVSSSFHEFDPARLRALVEARKSCE